jgi:hypothetical protein
MTRWTVLIIAAVTNVIAAVAFVTGVWWGGGPSTAKPLAIAGTVVIAAASLVILFVALRSARAAVHEPAGLPHDHSGWPHQPPPRADVEFRDRGQRFGPP